MKIEYNGVKLQFTPGEWVAGMWSVSAKNGNRVADVAVVMERPYEAIANAKLIAEAPELLLALMTIKSVLEEWDASTRDGKYRNLIFYADSHINRAISKKQPR